MDKKAIPNPRLKARLTNFSPETQLICEFAPYGLVYLRLGSALDRFRPRNHPSPTRASRSHIDEGKSEVVYPDSDMGGSRSPDPHSSVVGKLRNARATQMDIFGAARDHAGND
jgi:hypothetical protein